MTVDLAFHKAMKEKLHTIGDLCIVHKFISFFFFSLKVIFTMWANKSSFKCYYKYIPKLFLDVYS